MARSETIIRPRKRHSQQHHDEPRPVLQLPLERPVYRDPIVRDEIESERERGVAVIDFYI